MHKDRPEFANDQEALAYYKTQNESLRKINEALIYRIEEGGGNQNAAYSFFENSVHLSQQVKLKTNELNLALKDLQKVNIQLKHANAEATLFKQRFTDAIESIDQAFLLLDNNGNILLHNQRFHNLWREYNFSSAIGSNYYELKSMAKAHGVIRSVTPSTNNQSIYHLKNNTWFQLTEKRTSEAGTVLLFTDITALKQAESERYERAIAQKNALLQSLIDNLQQGVILTDAFGDVQVWNKQFLKLSQLQPLTQYPSLNVQYLCDQTELQIARLTVNDVFTQILSDGTVIEIRHHRLENGQVIKTYNDITKRHQYAESLKENERWLRTITDNVPAMIAYIDKDKRFAFINKQYQAWYQHPGDTLLGQSLQHSQLFNNYQMIEKFVNRALDGETVTFESHETTTSGDDAYLLKTYVPNILADGTTDGFFVMVTDITERITSANALQQAYDDLEERISIRTAELQAEVNSRKLAQVNLSLAKQEAESANESKTKFLAAVSHDLMQPLNAAQLFAASFHSHITAKQKSLLIDSIQNSLNDLENLIVTLIDISKLDAGVIQPDNQIFEVNNLLTNIAKDYATIAASQGIHFSSNSTDVSINTDSMLLARILRNYLSNAIKHSAAKHITMQCETLDEQILRISVSDDGKGIPESDLQDIYVEFKRLDQQKAVHHSLGLGLAIVDKMAKVLEIEIGVASEVGNGAVFWVDIPYMTDVSPTKSVMTMDSPLDQQIGKHVWVVDNDYNICLGMATLLNQWGMEVVTATSYEDLADQVDIQHTPCDVLLVDYHLDNNVTGIEVSDKITSCRATTLPVIMITANFSQALQELAASKNIRVLNKPLKPLKLKMALQNL